MNKTVGKNLKVILIALVLVLSVKYLYETRNDILSSYNNINILYLCISGVIYFLTILMTAWLFKVSLSVHSIKLKEEIPLSIVTSLMNYVLPLKAGTVYRSVYLKQKYGFAVGKFVGVFTGLYLLIFIVNAIINLILMTWLYITYKVLNPLLLLFFLALLAISLVIIASGSKVSFSNLPIIGDKVEAIAIGWKKIAKEKKLIKTLLSISLLNNILAILEQYFLFKSISSSAAFLDVAFLSSSSIISIFVNLTPGSLGVTEAIMAYSSTITAIPIASTISVQIVRRVLEILILIISGGFSYLYLEKRRKNL